MTVTFVRSEDAAANIKTFWFKPDGKFAYVAGQFIKLTVPHDNPDDRGIRRWFTLSSSPSEELVSITSKFAGPTSSTFKKALWTLKPGTQLSMVPPAGDFTLPVSQKIPLIMVAGGIGITPFRSMVKWLHDTHEQRVITLIYAVNRQEEMAFTDLFKDYALTFIPLVRDPAPGWQGQSGMLDANRVLQLAGDTKDTRVYVSGPEPMIEAIANGLQERGIEQSQLVTDFFPGYKLI